jgi:hypothetical protein
MSFRSKLRKLLLMADSKEWFAVTAFPLFACTFGTIASALNVCALAGPWRCEVISGDYDVVNYVKDPHVYSYLLVPYPELPFLLVGTMTYCPGVLPAPFPSNKQIAN